MPRPLPAAPAGLPPAAAPALPPAAPGPTPRPLPASALPAPAVPQRGTAGVPPLPAPAAPRSPQPIPQPATAPVGGGPLPVPVRPPSGGTAPVAGQSRADAIEEELVPGCSEPLLDRVKRFFRESSPSMLSSLIFHMLLVIVCSFFYVKLAIYQPSIAIDASYVDEIGEQTLDASPLSIETLEPAPDMTEMTLSDLPPVIDPLAAPPELALSAVGQQATSQIVAPAGVALQGRNPGMKRQLLGKYGGTGESEAAVAMALDWLARQQMRDGLWSLRGPYGGGGNFENREAATGMALLAFLGAGYTHKADSKYSKTVYNGVKALIRGQDREGNFYHGDRRDELFYAHAICTIAVCELYALTQDSFLKESAEKAVQFLVDSQDPDEEIGGGWRYRPRNDSDLSVTGWCSMALQSARMGGIEVPAGTFERMDAFLNTVQYEDGSQYGYIYQQPPDRVMTASGLLIRQYLGWPQDDPRLVAGAEYLMKQLPRREDRDLYYWYYATQFLHHMEGKYWEEWNKAQRDLLVESQEQSGRERGSWEPMGEFPDRWCQLGHGGRLYVTCLSVYNLEVYYRHLPLYSELRKELESRVGK